MMLREEILTLLNKRIDAQLKLLIKGNKIMIDQALFIEKKSSSVMSIENFSRPEPSELLTLLLDIRWVGIYLWRSDNDEGEAGYVVFMDSEFTKIKQLCVYSNGDNLIS